jgi:hypothetical protein
LVDEILTRQRSQAEAGFIALLPAAAWEIENAPIQLTTEVVAVASAARLAFVSRGRADGRIALAIALRLACYSPQGLNNRLLETLLVGIYPEWLTNLMTRY